MATWPLAQGSPELTRQLCQSPTPEPSVSAISCREGRCSGDGGAMPPMTWLDSLLHCWGTDPSKTGIGASHEPWRGGLGPTRNQSVWWWPSFGKQHPRVRVSPVRGQTCTTPSGAGHVTWIKKEGLGPQRPVWEHSISPCLCVALAS